MEHRGSVLLLQGWVLMADTLAPPTKLRLVGHLADGKPWEMDVPLNRQRLDVVAALGLPTSAAQCGFFFYGCTPEGRPEALRLESASGSTLVRFWTTPAHSSLHFSMDRLQSWRHLVRRGMRLLRSGQWRDLAVRVSKHVRAAMPRKPLESPQTQDTCAAAVDCLVIDHDLGGGANQFRRHWVANELAAGKSLVVLTFSLLGLRYAAQLHSPGLAPRILTHLAWDEVLPWIDRMCPGRIFYNNAVSFPEALALVQGLSAYKAERGATCLLTVAIHDYFMACPSQHLIHADGQYCQIPDDLHVCRDCLSRSQQDMVPLYRRHDLASWRQAWGTFLHAADEVLTFDHSANEILSKAHRPLTPRQLVLRPHAIPALSAQEQAILASWKQGKPHSRRRIGIVGMIGSDIKGARRVHELVQAIDAENLPYEIISIGQITPKPSGAHCFRETGPYKPQDLTKLVVRNNIDVFFFCSTGPETFSYVLHEIERFNLPVAAFDLGAQSTFLKRYSLAIPLNLKDSAKIILQRIACTPTNS